MTLTSSIPGGRANFFLSPVMRRDARGRGRVYIQCIYIILYTRYVYESVSTDLS